jgi:hypothetical protein
MLLFEVRHSINYPVTDSGIGVKRILKHFDMLDPNKLLKKISKNYLHRKNQLGLEQCSGLLHDNGYIGSFVKKRHRSRFDPESFQSSKGKSH